MIDRVSIQGFKSIVDAEVSLGALNVLVGANGAGKSNILEAIGLLGCAVSGRLGEEQFKYRGIRPGRPALFKSAFKDQKIHGGVTLEARSGTIGYKAELDNPIDHPENLWWFANELYVVGQIVHGARASTGAQLHRADGSRFENLRPPATEGIIRLLRTLRPDLPGLAFLDALEGYAIYTPFTPILRGIVPDPSPRDPIGLSGGDLVKALQDLRSRDEAAATCVDEHVLELTDWASSIHAAGNEGPGGRALYFVDRYMTASRNVLSATDASEGALYVLFLLLLLYHPLAPSTFAVDNIDSALHPRLARSLVERVQQLLIEGEIDRQILVTTHNPLVLDALRLEDDRVRLLIVSRQKGTGMTTIRRIEHSDALERAQSRGRTLSQLWVEGTLGGVPDLM